MTAREAGAALLEPLRDASQLMSGLLFWLLPALGLAVYEGYAGRFRLFAAGALAVALALSVPGLVGYLLRIVESRALGRRLEAPGIESFLPFSGERRWLPLVPAAALIALWQGLDERWPLLAAVLPVVLGAVLLPLHAMLLAITATPLSSVSPPALTRLARRLWPAWLWLPTAIGAAATTLRLASAAGLPGPLLLICAILWLLALASLCGALLATLPVAAEIGIAPPALPDARAQSAAIERQRLQVLDHAYGFVSRGNRAGGFAHIEQQVAAENDPLQADLWYFDALWHWDLGDVPLYYAQSLLTRLLDAGDAIAAMKVTLRCLRANPRFRPYPADLPRLREAAAALGNDEVVAALRR